MLVQRTVVLIRSIMATLRLLAMDFRKDSSAKLMVFSGFLYPIGLSVSVSVFHGELWHESARLPSNFK